MKNQKLFFEKDTFEYLSPYVINPILKGFEN